MRYVPISTALLLLGSAAVAGAQPQHTAADSTPPGAGAARQVPATPQAGPQQTVISFGYRGLWSVGDEARWERFRDLRSGVRIGGSFNRESRQALVRFNASNVAFRDQQYSAEYNEFGKLRVLGTWSSVPLNYAFNTMTPWKHQGGNVWTLDQAARTAVQNKTALGIPTTAADFNNASIYRGLATPFTLQSRRDIVRLGMRYRLNDAVGLNLGVNSMKRGGMQPLGGSFAFSAGTEHPLALDDRTNELTASVEWAKPSAGMLRAEWLGSWYRNQFTSLSWDNPLRITDYSNGKSPPLGPYDPSGYSNGNGAAVGRLSLAPSNSMNMFSLVGLRKLPVNSTVNAQFSYAMMKQDEALIPWTTNAVIMSPVVLQAFPHLAQLPRATAQADLRSVNALVNFTTRPNQYLGFEAHYRFNDRHNRTPMFDATEYVRFDAVPEENPEGESHYYDITRNSFETAATVTVIPNASLKIGYILDDAKRTGRLYRGLQDNTFRVSLDSYGNRWVMLRGIFEKTKRSGRGLSEEAIKEQAIQPATRYFDESPLDRNKGTVILQFTPVDKFDLGFSLAAGKDKYNDKEQSFGLLDNSNTSYNATVNFYPLNGVTFGGNYGYEKFKALQASRNANPFTGVAGAYESWKDPNRDWSMNNDETVKNLGLYLDVIKVLPRTDVRVSYDWSKSDNAYRYSGPRIQELSTNVALTPGDALPCGNGSTTPCFGQLPAVLNNWKQLRVIATHQLTQSIGVSAGYSYEKFGIVDFATMNLADGTPRIDPLGAITLGYGNRPYRGNTFIMQFVYYY